MNILDRSFYFWLDAARAVLNDDVVAPYLCLKTEFVKRDERGLVTDVEWVFHGHHCLN